MNREIKFRAFQYGKMHKVHSLDMYTHQDGALAGFDHTNGCVSLDHSDGAVFMQYTGLNDKNYNEVFEGDILKVRVGEGLKETRLYRACFNQGCFGLRDLRETDRIFYGFMPFINQNRALAENGFFDLEIGDVMEVVGNIYQHPELLRSALGIEPARSTGESPAPQGSAQLNGTENFV